MERNANAAMNGHTMTDITSSARKKGEWHVPILAMTADVIHATLDKCLKCGMDEYVSKPFHEQSLYHAVAKFFESKPNLN